MYKPLRSCLVTVFHLHRSGKTPGGLAIHYRRLGALRVASRGDYGRRERVAAEAWVRCEGSRRRDFLVQLGAPEPIIRHETDVKAIAAEIKLAPSGFGDHEAYVYDNGVESWLMLISCDTQPASVADCRMGMSRDNRVGAPQRDEIMPWSRWLPSHN